MKRSDVQQPAEVSLRRPLNTSRAVRVACVAAAAFGALNFIGALSSGAISAMDFLALITLAAGAVGATGSREGAYVTVVAMGINVAILALFSVALVTGQTVDVSAPSWLQLDVRLVVSVAALWCVSTLSVLVFGLWVNSSGRK